MRKAMILATGLALATSAMPAGADDAAEITNTAGEGVTVQYAGSVMIFQVANIVISSTFQEETYQASARFTAAAIIEVHSDGE